MTKPNPSPSAEQKQKLLAKIEAILNNDESVYPRSLQDDMVILLSYIRTLEKEYREMREALAEFSHVLEAWANDPAADGNRFLRLRGKYHKLLSSLTPHP